MPNPFANKFALPKFPKRKANSLTNLNASEDFTPGNNNEGVKARLGDTDVMFRDGRWEFGGRSVSYTEQPGAVYGNDTISIRRDNQRLVEENNFLKLKIDILLDMLAETTAEVHLQDNDIANLKDVLNKYNKQYR